MHENQKVHKPLRVREGSSARNYW